MMTNIINKKVKSCKIWGKIAMIFKRIWLFYMWYRAFEVFLYMNMGLMEKMPKAVIMFVIISGLLMAFGFVGDLIFSLVWSTKSYNLMLKHRSSIHDIFTKRGGVVAVLWSFPIICIYTKYRILKDLYYNFSDGNSYKKHRIPIRYVFYLLSWTSRIPLGYMFGSFDNPLAMWAWSIITAVTGTVAIIYYNKIIGSIRKFQDSLIDDSESKVEEKNEVKAGVKTKNFNYKKLLSIIFIVVVAGLVIMLFTSLIGNNNSSKTSTKHITTTSKVERKNKTSVSNQQIFENTIKCQEFKEQFLKEMVDYFGVTSFSYGEFGPNLAPLKKSIELFYSPITNSCLGIAYGDYTERNKFEPNNPDWTNKVIFSESLYVVQDIFTADRCRVKANNFYNDNGWLEEVEFYNGCRGLPAYDDKKFSMFEFKGDDIDEGLGLASEIFWNEVNYLKGK